MLTLNNEKLLSHSLQHFGLNSNEWILKKLKTKDKAIVINKDDQKIYFLATLSYANSGLKIKSLRLMI